MNIYSYACRLLSLNYTFWNADFRWNRKKVFFRVFIFFEFNIYTIIIIAASFVATISQFASFIKFQLKNYYSLIYFSIVIACSCSVQVTQQRVYFISKFFNVSVILFSCQYRFVCIQLN